MKALYYILLVIIVCSCGKTPADERIYFSRNFKQPYGCFIFHDYMKKLYEDSDWKYQPYNIKQITDYSAIFNVQEYVPDYQKLYVIYQNSYYPEEDELQKLSSLITSGGKVLLIASQINPNVQEYLSVSTKMVEYQENLLCISKTGTNLDTLKFPGIHIQSTLNKIHSQDFHKWLFTDSLHSIGIAKVLNNTETPNEDGKIIFVSSPTIFTNYFLLHKNNSRILEDLSLLIPEPSGIREVYWYDMGTRNTYKTGSTSHSLQIIFGIPALKWAFWIFLSIFALIYLFNIKRRLIKTNPPEPAINHSLKFVNTIALLYMQKGNHLHIAKKMAQQFYEHNYHQYQLRSDLPPEEWWEKFTARSGLPEKDLMRLKNMLSHIREEGEISDKFLSDFHQIIQRFYIKK